MQRSIEVFLAIFLAATASYLLVLKEKVQLKTESQKPKFWLYNEKSNYSVFDSIERVISKLGFERKDEDSSSPDMMKYDWELLWSYPYFSPNASLNVVDFTRLRPNQKLNHFPGNFHFINKYNLAKFTTSKYIPKGFGNLDDLLKYAKENPDAKYVQKNSANRGISLKNASEIDFSIHGGGGNFAQVRTFFWVCWSVQSLNQQTFIQFRVFNFVA